MVGREDENGGDMVRSEQSRLGVVVDVVGRRGRLRMTMAGMNVNNDQAGDLGMRPCQSKQVGGRRRIQLNVTNANKMTTGSGG